MASESKLEGRESAGKAAWPRPGAFSVLPSVWSGLSGKAAAHAGAAGLFVSGAAVAGAMCYPDVGMTSTTELRDVVRRVVEVSSLPVLVDFECGFGSAGALDRLSREVETIGARAVMIEDQEHPGQTKSTAPGLAPPEVLVDRIDVVRQATDSGLSVIARTDIVGADWALDESQRRLQIYASSGADALMLVYLRGVDDLNSIDPSIRVQTILVETASATGYVPDLQSARELGYLGIVRPSPMPLIAKHLLAHYMRSVREEDLWTQTKAGASSLERLIGGG